MNRVTLLSFYFFLAITITGCSAPAKKDQRPNILFAIADDASWKHFGAYGCSWVKTPAFDRVAEQGILFTRCYTPNAKCAPSRASIITGRNSWQLEEACNHSPFFPAKFKSYSEALSENGYWTGSTAKGWAPGDPGEINGKKRELTGQKFDKFKTQPPTKAISNNDYARNFEDFLEARPKGMPFCFWFGSQEPHRAYKFGSGIQQGGKSVTDIDEIPGFWPDADTIRTDLLDYAFEIEYFDSHLQRMLKKLEEIGELENTIVIVTADNGMPFPRVKGNMYEYGNHLPLAIMWPNGIKRAGRVVDDFVSFIDFVPTYLELAGITAEKAGMQPITGNSLTDIFNTENDGIVNPERDFVLVGMERHDVGRPNDVGYPVRGIVKGDYLFLRNFEPDRWPACDPETGYLNCDGSPTKTYILDTRRKKEIEKFWLMNFGKRSEFELYNIVNDPFCINNLAENPEFAERLKTMENEMTTKLTTQSDPRMTGQGEIFDRYEYAGEVKNFYNRFMAGDKVKAGWVEESDFEPAVLKTTKENDK